MLLLWKDCMNSQPNTPNDLEELPTNATPKYIEAVTIHKKIVVFMKTIDFGLMLDGNTFYKLGYEIKPKDHITFDMNQAYEIYYDFTSEQKKLLNELMDNKKMSVNAYMNNDIYEAIPVSVIEERLKELE